MNPNEYSKLEQPPKNKLTRFFHRFLYIYSNTLIIKGSIIHLNIEIKLHN